MDTAPFAHWLRIGLGRPILHLRRNDSRPYRETILDACLHDTVYDRQCEGSRAPYLFDVIAATGEPAYYRDHLLAASAPEALDGDDGEQVVALLGEFAKRGDVASRAQLRAIFATNATSERPDGASELVAAEGIAGLLTVAAQLPLDPDDPWFATMLVNDAAEIAGEAAIWTALRERAASDPKIATFLAAVEQETERRAEYRAQKKSPEASIAYAGIRSAILAGTASARLWRRGATDSDLLAAATDILREEDAERLKRLLQIFAERPFPLEHTRLLILARDPDERLAHLSRTALKNIAHPDVRTLGLALLADGNGAGARLLANNYQDDDFALIERLLRTWGDRDAIHALGFGLRDIVEDQPLPDATDALIALYEVDPCAICRRRAVKLLHQLGTIPDWLEAEYEYDSYR